MYGIIAASYRRFKEVLSNLWDDIEIWDDTEIWED